MFDFNLDFDFNLGFDDNDADDSKPGYQPEIKNRYLRAKKFKQVPERAVMYDNALDLVDNIGDYIINGETVHALLSGNFIFGDVIQALAIKKKVLFHDITISTLSFSQENVEMFGALIKGNFVNRLGIIVSDYFWSHNRHNAPFIYEALDHKDIFQLAVAGVHTKITLLEIQGAGMPKKKIVISGSANLRSSRSVEFVTFETNDFLYDFHHQWHLKILEDYGTIDRGVAKRAGALWDKIIEGVEHKDSWSTKNEQPR